MAADRVNVLEAMRDDIAGLLEDYGKRPGSAPPFELRDLRAQLDAITAATAALRAEAGSVGWMPVPGFGGDYEVSRDGYVRTVFNDICGQWVSDQGYRNVRLTDGTMASRKVVRVHRLVAEAFVPNPHGLPNVNHIDNDRANNHASNLEWCTQAENLDHMTRQGRRAHPMAGVRSPRAALTDEQVAAIRADREVFSQSHSELAAAYGVSKRTIGRILSGRSYLPHRPSQKE